MRFIDVSDLDSDPGELCPPLSESSEIIQLYLCSVVAFQHRYYIPLALGLGLIFPALIATLWDDAWGGFVWGGIIARLLSQFARSVRHDLDSNEFPSLALHVYCELVS